MKETIFDLISKPESSGRNDYFELAKNAPSPEDDSYLNKIGEYGKSVLKGTLEGVSRFGQMFGPLIDKPRGKALEEQTESLDKLLPTKEGFGQSALRRGLREAPTALAFPGSKLSALPRSLLAGFVGEGAKELGAPEWAQTAAELTAYIGPDITKKLLEQGKNADLIQAGRKLGLSDEALTPLLQSEFKQKWLSKLAPKRGSTQQALEKSKSELKEAYSKVQKEFPKGNLSPEATQDLLGKFKGIFNDIPSGVRKKVSTDLKDLLNKPITGESLINFYADVNHNLGNKTRQLSLLKEPIKKALNEISPEHSKDFEMINKLYSKYFPISKKLKPNLSSDIISAAESIGLLSSFATGYYPTMFTILGEKSAKKLAQQMLINPRLQQLSRKTVNAMNENKYQIVKKLTEEFSEALKDTNPDASNELDKISEDDIKKFLNRRA